MKKFLLLIPAAIVAIGMTSCASADKMAKMADEVTVVCNPSPLVLKGGKVEADLAVKCPKGFFLPKAIAEIIPVIVYEGGEEAMEPIMFQGEKVKNNYRVIKKDGATVNQHVCFPYKEGMAKSHLELRGRASTDDGKKWVTLPTKKVADGCFITETLAGRGFYGPKDHGYQEIITLNPEGQVMYLVNSSNVRASEYKSQSVKDFLNAINEIYGNDREVLQSIDIVAYASPEGSEAFNEKLSDNRSKSAKNAFDKITKNEELDGVRRHVKSVGEDWEGFQEMVSKSNVEDKDLILRVLSMYSDPNVREKEIRNMSSIYKDLAKDVLPQLRRARFIANVEYRNYSEAELQQMIKENINDLDETALLKAATLCKDKKDAKAIYNKAVEKFGSDKAKFALACIALDERDLNYAEQQVTALDATDPDVINLLGICKMREGDITSARNYFTQSGTPDAVKNLGLCDLKEGNYSSAAAKCGDKGCDAAVAQLLNGSTVMALNAIKDCNCPKAEYIRAICLARQGNNNDAKVALAKAVTGCEKLAERAKTDLEFAKL